MCKKYFQMMTIEDVDSFREEVSKIEFNEHERKSADHVLTTKQNVGKHYCWYGGLLRCHT